MLNNFTDYPHDLPGYPRRLHDAGYETAYIGKWHMGEDDDQQRPGFDFWMSHKGQGNYWDNEFNINGKRRVLKGYYSAVVTEAAVKWIGGKHEQPWLLVLGHKAPHGGPMVPSLDLTPNLLDPGGAAPLPDADGRSWKPLLEGNSAGWRTAPGCWPGPSRTRRSCDC